MICVVMTGLGMLILKLLSWMMGVLMALKKLLNSYSKYMVKITL